MADNKPQQENVKELLKLISENPHLQIVSKVDSDIVADHGYSYWLGGFGNAEIDRYYRTDERVYFEKYDREELVEEEWYDIAEANPGFSDEVVEIEAEKAVDELEWIDCIAVSIVILY